MDISLKLFYSDVFFTFVIEYPNFIKFIISVGFIISFFTMLFWGMDEQYKKLSISIGIIGSVVLFYGHIVNHGIDGINYYVNQNPNGLYSKQITEHCILEYLNEYKKAEFYPFVLSCVQEYAKENMRMQNIQIRNARERQDMQIKLNNRRQEEQKVKEQFNLDK